MPIQQSRISAFTPSIPVDATIHLYPVSSLHSFQKTERLCSAKQIEQLFEKGHRFTAYPFHIRWLLANDCTEASPCRILIVVPKRRFKHAVDRNLLKRRMRESYRKTKPALYDQLTSQNNHLIFSISYMSNEKMAYENMAVAMQKVIHLLIQKTRCHVTTDS